MFWKWFRWFTRNTVRRCIDMALGAEYFSIAEIVAPVFTLVVNFKILGSWTSWHKLSLLLRKGWFSPLPWLWLLLWWLGRFSYCSLRVLNGLWFRHILTCNRTTNSCPHSCYQPFSGGDFSCQATFDLIDNNGSDKNAWQGTVYLPYQVRRCHLCCLDHNIWWHSFFFCINIPPWKNKSRVKVFLHCFLRKKCNNWS